MNKLKRTLALMATLAMAATAFVGCGDEEEKESSSSSSVAEETDAPEEEETDAPEEEETDAPEEETPAETGSKSTELGAIDASLKTGGDTFTVAAWNADDVPYLIAQWKGCTVEEVETLDGVNFVSFGVGGGEASERYDQMFSTGEDLDVYFAEADWALKYINDDTKTVALEKLGFTDDNFAEIYGYTDEIGKDKNGVRKGVSWQAAAGGFAYRADLAEQYLGVTSPAEMQAQIGTWDGFVAAAQTIAEQSGNKTALADTLGGMWQAFACGRTQPWVVDNTLVIDDFCQDFADTAKALWDCGGVTKNSQWTDEWTAAAANDTCMGYFVSTWGFAGFFKDAATPTAGNWAVCQGPQSYYWGGTWMVVNPATDNAEEAQDFIKTFTVDNDAIATYAQSKPEYCNNSTVMDELIAANTVFNEEVTNLFKDGQNIYAELHENAKTIDFNGLITEYDATVKTNFVEAVKEEYLEAGASWDETKEAFMDKVSEDLPDLNW
ncbi:MAG: carbohydrate ABC transporter substrate-binding protein [Ruminococcus sp.]|nr:carbohydrate ABC transporter substrate-binding protein [Ruminococcus sp.]